MTTTATPEREKARLQPGAFRNDDDDRDYSPVRPLRSARALRLLAALLDGPTAREALDRRIGASNTPDVVMRLRARGFVLPCELRKGIDRDGRACSFGVYRLTASDADKATAILSERGE